MHYNMKKKYVTPTQKVVKIRVRPILAASENLPTSQEEATEWSEAKSSGGWFEDSFDESFGEE